MFESPVQLESLRVALAQRRILIFLRETAASRREYIDLGAHEARTEPRKHDREKTGRRGHADRRTLDRIARLDERRNRRDRRNANFCFRRG
jgi:hypothetical protein